MPWLFGTALLHSLSVTEKRGTFKSWTVLLAICAFAMSLLGTFLVRSGVLTSVHAFATDPKRGIFILGFLVFVIGASLALFAWRAPRVNRGGSFGLVSRESMLLGGNVVLVVAAASVMLGTLYPLVLDALGLGKISVGAPYFESVFVPLMAPALFLMGLAPVARWKHAELPQVLKRMRWAAGVGMAGAAVLPFVLGKATPMIAFGLFTAFWVLLATLEGLLHRLRALPHGGLIARFTALPRAYYGMQFAHLGIAVFVIGVTMVKGYESEKDVRMKYGEVVSVGGYDFRFENVRELEGVNYVAARGEVSVSRDGRELSRLYPEKRIYRVQKMPMTEAAIDAGWTRDLYVSLGEAVSDDAWTVRIYIKPFVGWIWGGCVLMALGALLAATDRRYRVRSTRRSEGSSRVESAPTLASAEATP